MGGGRDAIGEYHVRQIRPSDYVFLGLGGGEHRVGLRFIGDIECVL